MTARRAPEGEAKSVKPPNPRARAGITPIAYRPKDAAMALGVSRTTIYEMIADGTLEARKIGAATLISHEALSRLFSSAELSPTTKAAQASIK